MRNGLSPSHPQSLRWQQLAPEIRKEVTPKNIIMIGPTGVGKTEITRRLAKLISAAVHQGRSHENTPRSAITGATVESMARDLVEAAVALVKAHKRRDVEETGPAKVEERLVELLVPANPESMATTSRDSQG